MASNNEEIPFYKDDREKREKIQDNLPQNLPRGGTKEYKSLQEFCPKVEIILQTVNENEFYAATTFLKPPNDLFKKAVIFPENCIVLGKFGNKRVALIQTKVGDNAGNFIKKAHEIFSSAPYYIGIGVCYAFDDEKYKLGDVIVSEKICTLTNSAIGEIVEDRGQRIDVHEDLQSIFCRDRVLRPVDEFKVCEGRPSEIHCGPIISCPFLIKDAIFRDRILAATDNAIAGEMEGGQLLKFVNQGKVKGIIVIKGVVDYGDERKKKDWQFVTAMAALQYAECKLRNQPPLIPEDNIPPKKAIVTDSAHLNIRTICMELGEVAHKWFKIGVQLGISRGKLKEFEKEVDPLSAVIDHWLNDNVEDTEVPVSWKSVVAALKSSYVVETGLANRISSKYCHMHQNEMENKGSSPSVPVSSLPGITATQPMVHPQKSYLAHGMYPQGNFSSPKTASVLKKGISHSQLNIMKWRSPCGEDLLLRLKEEMSVKWRELGQNVGVSNAKLAGFRHSHLDPVECMNDVIQAWIEKGSQKYPSNWKGLVELLRDVQLNKLADQILQAVADPESSLHDN